MMSNGIVVCKPSSNKKNIGDYIQSVAAESFFDHVDFYVERESLSSFDGGGGG